LTGESVPDEERIHVKDTTGELTLPASAAVPSSVTTAALVSNISLPVGSAVTDVDRATWQQEKEKLYQQLDDKVIKHIFNFYKGISNMVFCCRFSVLSKHLAVVSFT